MDRNMIDTNSGCTLMDKNPMATKQLISNMATKYQQFGTIVVAPSRAATSEVSISMDTDNQRLENKLIELASLVRQLAIGQQQNMMAVNQPRLCGICCA